MERAKKNIFTSLLKSIILGIVISLILILVFAVILRFVDVSDGVITPVNQIIKAISIFVMLFSFSKNDNDKLLLKSIVLSFLFVVLSFFIFSFINGSFDLGIDILFDLIFGVIMGGICAVIINLFKK